jgi:hypothetical protein
MGACDFYNFAKGETAKEAFNSVVDRARYEYGHGGYTGTIAEKSSFVKVGKVKTENEASKLAMQMMDDDDDRRVSDKWGPAGCIEVEEPHGYLFFGMASS